MLHAAITDTKLEVGHATEPGFQKTTNDDAYLIFPAYYMADEEGATLLTARIAVVADGFGSSSSSGIASQLTVETLYSTITETQVTSIPERLADAIQRANTRVCQTAKEDETLRGAQASVIVSAIVNATLFVAHVGTCRAYLLRDGKCRVLTQDHTYAQDAITGELLSEEEAYEHPNRYTVTRSIGANAEIEVDSKIYGLTRSENGSLRGKQAQVDSLLLQPGDTVMLCSEGLTNVLSHEEIQRVVDSYSPSEAAQILASTATSSGGSEDVTIALMRWKGVDAPVVPVARRRSPLLGMAAVGLMVVLVGIAWFLLSGRGGLPDIDPIAVVVPTSILENLTIDDSQNNQVNVVDQTATSQSNNINALPPKVTSTLTPSDDAPSDDAPSDVDTREPNSTQESDDSELGVAETVPVELETPEPELIETIEAGDATATSTETAAATSTAVIVAQVTRTPTSQGTPETIAQLDPTSTAFVVTSESALVGNNQAATATAIRELVETRLATRVTRASETPLSGQSEAAQATEPSLPASRANATNITEPTDTPKSTNTNTPQSTSTLEATSTTAPTRTRIATRTRVATSTATLTRTQTAIPTRTPIPTRRATATELPIPTDTPTSIPTETNTSTPTRTSIPTNIPTNTPDLEATRAQQAIVVSTRIAATLTARPTNTNTSIPPTLTPVPPTLTPIPPTLTPVPPTFTPVPPTLTPVPPTLTPVPPTLTPVPPTLTPIPPTLTPIPPTRVPPTLTPVPPTPIPPTPTRGIQVNVQGANASLSMVNPSESTTVFGNYRFEWSTNVILQANQGLELVLWKPNENPMTQSFGLAEPTSNSFVQADLEKLDNTLGNRLEPGIYFAGVLLVEKSPYKRIQLLGNGREIRFERSSSGGSSSGGTSGE